nr:MAG TPA: hypothetical protein [Bacteriophage sp.]
MQGTNLRRASFDYSDIFRGLMPPNQRPGCDT